MVPEQNRDSVQSRLRLDVWQWRNVHFNAPITRRAERQRPRRRVVSDRAERRQFFAVAILVTCYGHGADRAIGFLENCDKSCCEKVRTTCVNHQCRYVLKQVFYGEILIGGVPATPGSDVI